MMSCLVLVVLALTCAAFAHDSSGSHSRNRWDEPCLYGVCSYTLPESSGAGTLTVTGSPDAITDITSAAGWEILECDPNSISQDIRLICTGSDGCEHLYRRIGVEGKIARLPESCGPNAFAHISRPWVPQNQAVPEDIAKKLARRGHVDPEVKALHIDTNFSALDTSTLGIVSFSITAAGVPGGTKASAPIVSSKARRQWSLGSVNISKGKKLEPFSMIDSFNVFNAMMTCEISGQNVEARMSVDIIADVTMEAEISVVAQGTIIPPKVTKLEIAAGVSADLNGSMWLQAALSGKIFARRTKLFEAGVPGLSFPGILSIGPSFIIESQVSGSLDNKVDLKVGINYKVNRAQIVYPPRDDRENDGAFTFQNTPLKLSVTPATATSGTITGHIIPSLNLGISALGGIAETNVFIELDSSGSARLSLEGSALLSAPRKSSGIFGGSGNHIEDVRSAESADLEVSEMSTASSARIEQTLGGCFEALTGLGVNVGVTAGFFGLLSAGMTHSVYNKQFELLKKCFGANQPSRRGLRFARNVEIQEIKSSTGPLDTFSARVDKRDLVCPSSGDIMDALAGIVDTIISPESAVERGF